MIANTNTLNAALWRVQFAKLEQQSRTSKDALGSWNATQEMANLIAQESALLHAINLAKAGVDIGNIDTVVENVFSTLPEVN